MRTNSSYYRTAIDLFSGCGGLTLGLKQSRFNVVAAVEIDELACEAYRNNHPEVLLFKTDIRQLSGKLLLETIGLKPGELDILAGCPPCQGFSRMTRKNRSRASQDPRNGLVLDLLRLVRSLRPKVVLMENVPGLQSHWRFATLKRGLTRAGYVCSCGVLNAANFGVPQRRKRLILLASRLGPITLPSGKNTRTTVRNAIGAMPSPGKSTDPLHSFQIRHSPQILKIIKDIPKDGGSRLDLGIDRQLECHRKFKGFKDVYGRMRWNSVSPTITGSCFNPSKGRFLHPVQNRAISLREAAILQTFTRQYRFPDPNIVSRAQVALLIGNALPPQLARAQGFHIGKHLKTWDMPSNKTSTKLKA